MFKLNFLLQIVLFIQVSLVHAQEGLHGIVDVTLNCLLGGSTPTLWHGADFTAERLQTGSRYRVYTLYSELPSSICTEIYPAEPNGPPEPNQIVLSPEPVSSLPVIGIGGSWQALPRIPENIAIDNAFILEDVSRVMEEIGLPGTKPQIKQSIEIDLEGDNEQEWLLILSNQKKPSPHAKKGDYALALLGKWIDAHPVHFIILSDVHHENVQWAAPLRFQVRAVLDTNGDGNMEIFIYNEYYEGGATSVHRYTDGEVYELLRAGWGH